MKQTEPSQTKNKKTYQKPVLIRYEKLTAVIAGGGNSAATTLGCTRF